MKRTILLPLAALLCGMTPPAAASLQDRDEGAQEQGAGGAKVKKERKQLERAAGTQEAQDAGGEQAKGKKRGDKAQKGGAKGDAKEGAKGGGAKGDAKADQGSDPAEKGAKKDARAEAREAKARERGDQTKQGVRLENPGLRGPQRVPTPADRTKKARDEAQGERIEKARDQVEGDKKRAANARGASAEAAAKVKHVDELTRRVRAHRVRLAELKRLEGLFEARGDAEKVERVARLRSLEQSNYEMVLERYETLLGQEDFAAFRKRVQVDDK